MPKATAHMIYNTKLFHDTVPTASLVFQTQKSWTFCWVFEVVFVIMSIYE